MMSLTAFRLFHPLVLLGGAVAIAAVLTSILPAGQYDRRDDPDTGRRVVVAGTYHSVEPAPVGPFAAALAIPRGFIAAAEVVAVILFVGGAWVVADRLGTLPAVVAALVRAFAGRGLWMIPIVSLFFATMGALENMQEEIIPLVPALLVLGVGLGIDAVTVVAMSAGAAMVGSAFGPTNPFQAGIALKLAQLPPLSGGGLRLAMLAVGYVLWTAWTMRYVRSHPVSVRSVRLQPDRDEERLQPDRDEGRLQPDRDEGRLQQDPTVRLKADTTYDWTGRRHVIILAIVLAPMAAYVYGALRLG